MKLFTSALLLLCMSALCITSIAGFYNKEHPNVEGQTEPHKISKRQEVSDQDYACNQVLASEVCTNGQYQEYASLSQRCNDSVVVQFYQDVFCAYNQMDIFCGLANYSLLLSNIAIFCNNSSPSCSQDCRDHLIRARSELGCCINAVIDIDEQFAYPMWSRCGVEPVTRKCSTSFTLPPIQVDPTCDEDAYLERSRSITCRQPYVEGLRERLTTEGCQGLADEITFCKANQFGTYCDTLEEYNFESNLTLASWSCRNISICDPLCIETLDNIINTLGCCFNDRYNTTNSDQYYWLSYEFWSMCGLESPGLCE